MLCGPSANYFQKFWENDTKSREVKKFVSLLNSP